MTDERTIARLGPALLRLLALAIILVAEELIDGSSLTSGFGIVYAAAWAYAVLALVAAASARAPVWLSRIELLLDLLFLCALDLTSGGPSSQVPKLFFVLPLAAAATRRPRFTAIWAALAVAGFVAVSLPHPDARDPGGGEFTIVEALFLAWTGAAATFLAWQLSAREQRIRTLARDRGRLLAQTLDAAQLERKRIAYSLHDHTLQNVLAASFELYSMETADDERRHAALHALELTRSQLRETIFELQPLTLEDGVEVALAQLAEHYSSRRSIAIEVFVHPEAPGAHDQLVYVVARELLANAVSHSGTDLIDVTIDRRRDDLIIEVSDEGRGIPAGRLEKAVAEGHIGLAATRDRVRALDGELTIDSRPGQGTVVRATIPTRRAEDRDSSRRPNRLPGDRRRSVGRRRRFNRTPRTLSLSNLTETLSRLPAWHELYARHHSTAAAPLTNDQVLERFRDHATEGALDGIDEDTKPRIILVAKSFQIEVTATVLWLRETWSMHISCVELVPYAVDGKLLLSSSVRIPLPEASEYTVKRDQKRQKAQATSKVDWQKAMEVMALIPPGHWMSYQDLAVAAGGTPRAGMAVGQYLAKSTELPPDCVHRVVRSDGTVSPGFRGEIGGAQEAQALLESEGPVFDERGRADASKRWKR